MNPEPYSAELGNELMFALTQSLCAFGSLAHMLKSLPMTPYNVLFHLDFSDYLNVQIGGRLAHSFSITNHVPNLFSFTTRIHSTCSQKALICI